MAGDFGISTATAGQLRSVSGLGAGLGALAMGAVAARLGLRNLLLVGLALLAVGSLGSAAAPTFDLLLAAQIAVGGGLALVLSGGLAAAAAWTAEEQRAQVLSWTLVGQPGAWIVGMPVWACWEPQVGARRWFRRYWTFGVGSGAHVLVNGLLELVRDRAEGTDPGRGEPAG